MGLIMEEDRPIILVVGARPNFMKIAPLYAELERRGVNQILLHTGQHYDEKMSRVFFDDLGLPEPDIYLGVGSGSHSEQTAKVMVEFEKICIDKDPELVVVVGDVNSTLGCTLVSAKMNIKSAHIEAGLRSGDMKMPEEVNRIVTDALADILLTPSVDADKNLISEGRNVDDIYFVGNIMIDSLINGLEKISESDILGEIGILKGEYGVITLHRPSNVDNFETLEQIISALEEISEEKKLVFPVHPRTNNSLEKMGLKSRLEENPNIILTPPLGYLDFMSLIFNSGIVLTDSGGLQEETTYLGITCLTLRDSTERPITVTEGTNIIVGSNKQSIIMAFRESMEKSNSEKKSIKYWDGKTASRIADVITKGRL
tara:strand:- start:739 stop:1854 length:1116 start_codon:yes stop_codon:yes gene_type:complete